MLHQGGSGADKASGCRPSWHAGQCPAVPMSRGLRRHSEIVERRADRRRADRLPSLDGARIAFLWDYLFRGDELFPVLEAELRERFPGVDIVGYDVFGNLHGSDEDASGDCPMICGHGVDAVVSAWGVEAPARPP